MELEASTCQTSDIMAILEDENDPDCTKSTDRVVKSSSTACRRDIPEHLLFDILLCLPVSVLLRFKSICKSWYALIGSSIFVAQHFDHNCNKDNLLCLLRQHDEDYHIVGYKFCLLSGNKYEVCSYFDCGQFGFTGEVPFISLALSSNGVICLVLHKHEEVALWNPATKQLKLLPKSSVSYELKDVYFYFGFGYDVKSGDYKVVRTIGRNRYIGCTNVYYAVEVYSLKADSWKTILKEDSVLPFKYLRDPISRDGTCFWITSDSENLVSFDLNDETYGTIPLPGNGFSTSTFNFLGDKLVYIHEFSINPTYFEIWVMHEYDVKESWSKVWKLGPLYDRDPVYPVGFSKNGLLLNNRLHDGGKLYLYNLGTEENEYLQLQHPVQQQDIEHVYPFVCYTESLVSIKWVNDGN